ncbi:ISL3 family transposase [Noviherbaspirillum pedocola]|uniref:ISL3 family transposase n=1 Tax=Noviherbaspirillum pedocola TaxID=2801341 RepID=A0A934WA03_9BURK|nr:ISL3 family transposase [Noviherbaspirillum pedocola]MBK4737904.1 ISL3 family transposase [Noviherbaspirillum pedocola]
MALRDITAQLGCWEGYLLRDSWEETRSGQRWCVMRLEPKTRSRRCCSGCGRRVNAVHDKTERRVRDLPVFEVPVELVVTRLRMACGHCGPRLERLDWLAPYARVTTRLAASVARLCKVMSVRHVAEFYRLSWTAVKRIDLRTLERELGPVDLSGVTIIAMDEFAIQKGHRYATGIVEPASKRVLWVGRGRSREEIRPFFELLGAQGCAQLRAAVMDMNTAYDLEVRMHCPQAEIVYDLFHVVAKYGREVIDRVRVDEANRLRGDRAARKVVKSSRWLLLRNRENVIRENDQIRLNELLAANQALMTVYVLKDDLKALWNYRHRGYAMRFWEDWYERAISSGIGPLCQFARRLKPYLAGILAHTRWPLGTNLVEGINNRIKVIKRMAYGYRDDYYFFLKIRAAFPGNR